MGYLVLKDLGANEVTIDSSTKELVFSSSLGQDNPSQGFINLKAFKFTFESESEVDDSPCLTEKIPRITVGNSKIIPISLSANYSREVTDRTTETGLSPEDINVSCLYIERWSRSKSILYLYWMPDDDTDIVDTNCKDYYSSSIMILNKNHWDSSWLSKTNNGYTGTANYVARGIPIVINYISIEETAEENVVKVTVNGYLVPPEEQ